MRKFDLSKERISKLGDRSVVIIHCKEYKEKRMKEKMNFRNLETPSSMPTFVDFQKMRREKEIENIWRNHGQYFPKLGGKHQSTHPKSSVNHKQVRCTPQLIIVKLLKGRERILETAIKKSLSKYQGSSLKLTLTFLMISHQKSWLPAGSRICLKYWKERIVNKEFRIQQNCSSKMKGKLRYSQINWVNSLSGDLPCKK